MSMRKRWGVWTAVVGLALAGCSDSEDTVTEEPALEEPELEEEEAVIPDDMALGNAGLKKLTRSQYVNSLRDVIGEELEVPPTGEPDAESGGLVAVGSFLTPYSGLGIETFESAAFAMAEQ